MVFIPSIADFCLLVLYRIHRCLNGAMTWFLVQCQFKEVMLPKVTQPAPL